MAIPLVPPWIKELRELSSDGIEPSYVRPFVAVIVEARQGQVAKHRAAAVLLGDDVVDGKRDCGVVGLRHPAILAGVVGSASDFVG
jgi:hypothetical protein